MSEPAEHQDEYHDAMIDMLELIWGQGFLIPAGPENARRIVAGLDLRERHPHGESQRAGGRRRPMHGNVVKDQRRHHHVAAADAGNPGHQSSHQGNP